MKETYRHNAPIFRLEHRHDSAIWLDVLHGPHTQVWLHLLRMLWQLNAVLLQLTSAARIVLHG